MIFNLPRELIQIIYEMDCTYANKFKLCINELLLLKIEKKQKMQKKNILEDINNIGLLPEYHRDNPDSDLTAPDLLDWCSNLFFSPIVERLDELMENADL